jgi:glycosyltransferase involved in cell wall biosynthesis
MASLRPSQLGAPRSRHAHALPGLTIVLPCLNEAENLAETLKAACAAAACCAQRYEIVVVDDGSSDETWEIANDFAEVGSRIRLVMHASNLGYGAALRSGIAAARMPWVLLIDADLQYDIGELATCLPAAAWADLVVGRRIEPQDTTIRRAADAAWRRLLYTLLRLPARDVTCGFRLARLDLLVRLELRASGGLIGAELLVKTRAAGARIAEAPVHHRVRVAGRQTGPGRRLSARTARELIELRRIARYAAGG